MSEPQPLPPLPQPFEPQPRPLRSPGCGRGPLIGCGVLIALVGLAAVGLSFRADEILVWLLKQMEQRVAAGMSAEVTAAERERFHAAFASLYETVEAGEVDPAALQSLQRELLEASGDVENLSPEQVRELTAAAERAAGAGSPPS